MPFFIKKEEEHHKQNADEIINELSEQSGGGGSPPFGTEAEAEAKALPSGKAPTSGQEKFIKKSTEQKSATLPLGTITVSIFTNEIEFARFTIKPELFSESAELIKNLISNINKPQLKITSNCDCIWCQQKSKELEEFLLE